MDVTLKQGLKMFQDLMIPGSRKSSILLDAESILKQIQHKVHDIFPDLLIPTNSLKTDCLEFKKDERCICNDSRPLLPASPGESLARSH